MAKRMAEWQNGRKRIHSYTYVLFRVHADDDDDDNDDDDTDDSLIFYSIEVRLYKGDYIIQNDVQDYITFRSDQPLPL